MRVKAPGRVTVLKRKVVVMRKGKNKASWILLLSWKWV